MDGQRGQFLNFFQVNQAKVIKLNINQINLTLRQNSCKKNIKLSLNVPYIKLNYALINIKHKLNEESFEIVNSDIPFLPKVSQIISEEDFLKVSRLIELLEDLDDVQDVYTNFDIQDKELETILE